MIVALNIRLKLNVQKNVLAYFWSIEEERFVGLAPVGDAAIAGDGVEVEVAVQVVLRPFDLYQE
jgi:hypothetical protein